MVTNQTHVNRGPLYNWIFFSAITLAFTLIGCNSGLDVHEQVDDLIDNQYAKPTASASVVNANTLDNKIMAGYQGWFMCKGDGANVGWRHWSGSTPNANNIHFDMWPDLREYDSDELFSTSFKYSNGKNAGLYSAYSPKTVNRHVKWMKDYGIDGVFVQRFLVEAISMKSVRDRVLQNIRKGAEAYGRVFANMYDLAGSKSSTRVEAIKNDWKHLVDDLKITQSNRYLRHKGRPVLAIWGIGFGHIDMSSSQAAEIISWFTKDAPSKYRVTLMGGVDPKWRSHSSSWRNVYRSLDIISPWAVGRYSNNSGADNFKKNLIIPDLKNLQDTDIDYLPVVFPGFSWWNLKNGSSPLNKIPRRGGRFFWRQFYNVMQVGCKMVYVAMFDEVDEGTAIYKIAENKSHTPTTGRFVTLDIDGESIPSDWYLRLTGAASSMLRGDISLTSSIPISTGGGSGNQPLPKPPNHCGRINSGQGLKEGAEIKSCDGRFNLILQNDGNLVLYKHRSTPLWSSRTHGKPSYCAFMQSDGNFVVYTQDAKPLWSSGTNSNPGSWLAVQNDGNVVIYKNGKAIWASNTHGH